MRRIKISEDQLTLPFGERSASRTISYDARARAFWLLCLVSLCSLIIYFYAINATARNIALREHLESGVTERATRLGELEFAYIELKNNVDMELAYQYGFEEAANPLYVSRDRDSALTLNTVKR